MLVLAVSITEAYLLIVLTVETNGRVVEVFHKVLVLHPKDTIYDGIDAKLLR